MPSRHEQAPSPEQIPEHEAIQFEETGLLALSYSRQGDQFKIGDGITTDQKLDIGRRRVVIINTNSGNQYRFGKGWVINQREGIAYPQPEAEIDITVGEACEIPGIARTTGVDNILIENKFYRPGWVDGEHTIPGSDPFKNFHTQIDSITEPSLFE